MTNLPPNKILHEICISRSETIIKAMNRLNDTGAGILILINENGTFERTITDGDLRRLLIEGKNLYDDLTSISHVNSITLQQGLFSRREVLDLMTKNSINHLPVLNSERFLVDLLDRRFFDEILLSTPHLGELELKYVEEAFKTNWIAPLGPNVDAFENELACAIGVKSAAAVSSGTAAIHLALQLLNVNRGDTVFCSTLTFVATANPILYQGARPVFIDSEPETWNMSPAALGRALHDAKKNGVLPKAVLVVNLYGQSADMDAIVQICDAYGVPIIEDAAESLGAKYKNKHSGTFGKLGIFSFNGNKIITTSGGGMVVSDDEELIQRARFLSTQARESVRHYEHKVVGYNYRLSNVLAGIGRGQLKVLDERVQLRRDIFDRYVKELSELNIINWMPEPNWSYSNRWLTAGTVSEHFGSNGSLNLQDYLIAELIEVRPVWKPMHLQPLYTGAPYYEHQVGYSVSDRLYAQGICLPSGSNMSMPQQDRVIDAIRRFAKIKN